MSLWLSLEVLVKLPRVHAGHVAKRNNVKIQIIG